MMMINLPEGRTKLLLLKTVAETNQELSSWVEWLTGDYYLELGSDPIILKKMERSLEQLAERFMALDPHFDIAKVPIPQVNSYFTVTSQLENAVSLVRDIRHRAYGTPQNTRRCLEQLEACMLSVREMSRIVAPGFSPQMH